MTTLIVLATLSLSACSTLPPTAFIGQGPEMRPERFFLGTTTSWGVLETRGGAPSRTIRGEGHGRIEPDGVLVLDQTVRYADRKPDQRQWRLRQVGAGRYAGTLTDASGPVTAEVSGNLFHLRYPLKAVPGGSMEQWLYLQDDRRTVLNVGTARVLGVTVVRLSERITHGDPAPSASGRSSPQGGRGRPR